MSLSKYFLHTLVDIWGIALTLYMYCGGERYLKIALFPSKIMRFKILENFEMGLDNLGLAYTHVKKVILTEYLLLLMFTCISIFISFIVFALFPTAVRIISHFLLLFLAQKFLPNSEKMTDLHTLYAAIVVGYTIVGVWRAISQRKETERLSDVIVGSDGRRSSFTFFISVVVAIFFMSLFHLNLRLLDFNERRLFPVLLYIFFVLSQLATVKYLTRCVYCLFFFRSRITGFRPVLIVELVPLIFTACLAGMLRPINLLGIALHKYLLFIGFDSSSLPIMKILDNNRLKLYYAAVCSKPYFCASIESRKLLWHGELRDRMTRNRLLEPLFPLIVATFLMFLSLFSGIVDFFRIQDVLVIQATYFFFALEVFNTFAIVNILGPYYNPISGDFSRHPDHSKVEDKEEVISAGSSSVSFSLKPDNETSGKQRRHWHEEEAVGVCRQA
ncbi:hypothetical protein PAEPH01_1503 [Pancytospora epiphaga]|nr:hypothetical protein PAEPH01_1503 [Pancytospora epiphaga]